MLAPEGDKEKPARATTLLLFLEKENLAELTSGRQYKSACRCTIASLTVTTPKGGGGKKNYPQKICAFPRVSLMFILSFCPKKKTPAGSQLPTFLRGAVAPRLRG